MRERGRAWAAGPRGTQQSALARSGHVARRWRPRRSFPSRRWAPSRPGAPEVRPSRARSDPAARGCRARPGRAAPGGRAARARPRARAAPAGAAGRRRAGTGSSSPPRRLAPQQACSLAGRLRSAPRRGARGARCRPRQPAEDAGRARTAGPLDETERRRAGDAAAGVAQLAVARAHRARLRSAAAPRSAARLVRRVRPNQERRHAPRCLPQEADGLTAAPRTLPAHRLRADAGHESSRRGPPQNSGNSTVRDTLEGVPAEQTSLLARSRAHVVSILWARPQRSDG